MIWVFKSYPKKRVFGCKTFIWLISHNAPVGNQAFYVDFCRVSLPKTYCVTPVTCFLFGGLQRVGDCFLHVQQWASDFVGLISFLTHGAEETYLLPLRGSSSSQEYPWARGAHPTAAWSRASDSFLAFQQGLFSGGGGGDKKV